MATINDITLAYMCNPALLRKIQEKQNETGQTKFKFNVARISDLFTNLLRHCVYVNDRIVLSHEMDQEEQEEEEEEQDQEGEKDKQDEETRNELHASFLHFVNLALPHCIAEAERKQQEATTIGDNIECDDDYGEEEERQEYETSIGNYVENDTSSESGSGFTNKQSKHLSLDLGWFQSSTFASGRNTRKY